MNRLLVALTSLVLLGAGSGATPLVEAPAPKEVKAQPDYCVVQKTSGSEGMPDYLHFHCTNGVEFPTMTRWCWRSKCVDGFFDDAAKLLGEKGYEPLASFSYGRPKENTRPYPVFQKGQSTEPKKRRLCLALRWGDAASAHYRIDCADGAVTEITVPEPENGLTAIAGFMKERGYEIVGRFEAVERFQPVLFEKR